MIRSRTGKLILFYLLLCNAVITFGQTISHTYDYSYNPDITEVNLNVAFKVWRI
jgi:hypothetical protein